MRGAGAAIRYRDQILGRHQDGFRIDSWERKIRDMGERTCRISILEGVKSLQRRHHALSESAHAVLSLTVLRKRETGSCSQPRDQVDGQGPRAEPALLAAAEHEGLDGDA